MKLAITYQLQTGYLKSGNQSARSLVGAFEESGDTETSSQSLGATK